jgi:hypothetical protein
MFHFRFQHVGGCTVAGVVRIETQNALHSIPLLRCKQLVVFRKALQQMARLLVCADHTRKATCDSDSRFLVPVCHSNFLDAL